MRKRRKSSRITITDVAEKAGVSVATISRALNDDPLVSSKTREYVKSLAEQLGYRPSQMAARFAKGRTGIINLLVPSVQNPIYAMFIEEILKLADEHDCEVLTSYSQCDAEHEKAIIQSFYNIHTDGFILLPEYFEQNYIYVSKLANIQKKCPIVLRQDLPEDAPFDSACANFEQGSYEATRHLIELGHRNIRFLGYHLENAPRPKGFFRALTEAGIHADPTLLVRCEPTIESAYKTSYQLIKNQTELTAIVAQSDYYAFGLLRAANELNKKIPQDISVVSFDGIELGNYGYKPLTTMSQPVEQISRNLIEQLFSRMEDPLLPIKHVKIPMKLIVRSTTATARV